MRQGKSRIGGNRLLQQLAPAAGIEQAQAVQALGIGADRLGAARLHRQGQFGLGTVPAGRCEALPQIGARA
jgi:hypothetical protein